jgi:hypothetical protein
MGAKQYVKTIMQPLLLLSLSQPYSAIGNTPLLTATTSFLPLPSIQFKASKAYVHSPSAQPQYTTLSLHPKIFNSNTTFRQAQGQCPWKSKSHAQYKGEKEHSVASVFPIQDTPLPHAALILPFPLRVCTVVVF